MESALPSFCDLHRDLQRDLKMLADCDLSTPPHKWQAPSNKPSPPLLATMQRLTALLETANNANKMVTHHKQS
jgi:hypothetical protein